MLKRKFYDSLVEWKNKARHKPLLIRGARQIGKTYIVDYFGRNNYASYIYINFLENGEYRRIFDGAIDAKSIYSRISLFRRDTQLIEGNTLIFLDEIQECGEARTALKFLAEDGRYDIVASGSLLGIQYKNVRSVPVGYEEQAVMHSLDFEEFLWAKGYDKSQIAGLKAAFDNRTKVDELTNDMILREVREYMVVGGMPEVVETYLRTGSFREVDEVQQRIVADYLDDIVNYAQGPEKPKTKNCFLSIPRQLARESENRKFKYAEVEKGVGARKYGNSVEWLRDASMVEMARNLSVPRFPLSAYAQDDVFKLYMSDVGLLTSLYGYETKAAVIDKRLAGSVKGALYENLIASMLVRNGHRLWYFRDKHEAQEVEFLVEKDMAVVPVEVKASNAGTISLNRLLEREDIKLGYKLIDGNVGVVGKKVTLPHYMAMFI